MPCLSYAQLRGILSGLRKKTAEILEIFNNIQCTRGIARKISCFLQKMKLLWSPSPPLSLSVQYSDWYWCCPSPLSLPGGHIPASSGPGLAVLSSEVTVTPCRAVTLTSPHCDSVIQCEPPHHHTTPHYTTQDIIMVRQQ